MRTTRGKHHSLSCPATYLGVPGPGEWAGASHPGLSFQTTPPLESGSGNGSSTLNPLDLQQHAGRPGLPPEMNGNGAVAPMDFTASARISPSTCVTSSRRALLWARPPTPPEGLQRLADCGAAGLARVKTTPEVCGAAGSPQL